MEREMIERGDVATLSGAKRPRQGTALAQARYERLLPFRLRLGPVTITLACLVLVGLLAMAYLGQVASVASANQRLQALQAQQDLLRREDEEAHARLGAAQSPAYIRQRAQALGLVPAPPGSIQVIAVPAPTATPGGRP
jgi:cell division protein FtsB